MGNKKTDIFNLRKEYGKYDLNENSVSKNPFVQFESWMNLALAENVNEPHAMTLSTCDKNGQPSSRIVLLRGFDKKGFIFYTNYKSRKGKELLSNPYACLNFFWAELEKQVRIEGQVKKNSKAISDSYFSSRPRESQIGAWASQQSTEIKNRDELEKTMQNLTKKFEGKPVPRPAHWGGYCLSPDNFEFWQGRANRLHDRIFYEKKNRNKWKVIRLSP